MRKSDLFPIMFVPAAAVVLFAAFTQKQVQSGVPQLTQAAAATQDGADAVNEFNRRFVEGCRKRDLEGAALLWADDGVDLLPGMDPMVGKPAITHWLRGLIEQSKDVKILQCDVDWQGTSISGDVAYEWGINTQTISTPDHPEPLKNKGKITLILRKQRDGSWKLALESWNSSPREKAGA